jgi:putative transposase
VLYISIYSVCLESFFTQQLPFQTSSKKGDLHPNIVGGYVQWQTVQLADQKNTKKLFPEYKQLDAQVLQDVGNRVESTFSRFTTPDIKGNRSGKPRFRGKHYYKSFTYTQLCNSDITKDERGRFCINLAKIGLVPMVFHRSIPDGFKVKTGTVVREADGWYINLTLEDKDVPVTVAEIQPTEENSIGIDLGVENYVTLESGETVEHPRFLRTSANRLAKLQKRLASKPKHSKPWKILKVKIAKLHQHIARQRLDFQFNLAYWIFSKCDVLFIEDLKLKNLTRRASAKIDNSGQWLPNGQAAKSGLNKSLLDAAHGQFVQVLKFVAWKLGKVVREIDPSGTSGHCWSCLNKVAKDLADRWHSCQCGQELHRDDNSAKLIKKIGLICAYSGEGHASLKTARDLLVSGRSPRCTA